MRVFGFAALICFAATTAFVARLAGPLELPPPAGPELRQTAGTVAGTVVDPLGRHLPDVTVELLRGGVVIQSAKTNARGEFSFADVPQGLYEVRASHEGLVPTSLRVVVNDQPGQFLVLSIGIPAAATDSERSQFRVPQATAAASASAEPSKSVPMPPPPRAAPVTVGGRLEGFMGSTGIPSLPAPDFNTEAYDRIDDNPFRRTTAEPLSTFSIDVDTASYANVRRFLNDGTLPPADAVRVEELVNYFRFAYSDALEGHAPFGVTTEVAACPWNPRHKLALIGLQARRDENRNPARNLVFLLDVSGSMMPADKLPLVKTAMRMLVDTLTSRDRVAIVVYAGASGLALPSTSGDRKADIKRAIEELQPGGSTNGAAGIQLAYNTAASNVVEGGVNRVILATDGDFNVGVTSQGELVRLIERERERGIFLSVLGVGTGNLKDSTMEKLADKGNGNYAYLDSLNEARRVLIHEASATLVTVAKDVKIQIEFNPQTVGAYRLVGYENRILNHQDFNDDKKDAGEMGAGHTVTALYELIPPGEPIAGGNVDPLVYQDAPRPAASSRSGELMNVKIRYKHPDSDRSQLVTVAVRDRAGELTANIGFAAAVTEFGMLLRNSEFKGQATWSSAQSLARKFRGEDSDGYRAEFVRLVDLAAALDRRNTNSLTSTRPDR